MFSKNFYKLLKDEDLEMNKYDLDWDLVAEYTILSKKLVCKYHNYLNLDKVFIFQGIKL